MMQEPSVAVEVRADLRKNKAQFAILQINTSLHYVVLEFQRNFHFMSNMYINHSARIQLPT